MATVKHKSQKLNFTGFGDYNKVTVVQNTSVWFTSSVTYDDTQPYPYAPTGSNNTGAAAFIVSGSSLVGGVTASGGGILNVDQLEPGKVYPIGIQRASSGNTTTHIIVLKR